MLKITGTSSYILIEYDYRTVRIQGELTNTPTFYAFINSIKYWEPPYGSIEISEAEKEDLINIVNNQNNPDFKIIFE